uniref:Uridine cytidine kinase I n=1 Tax=Solanum tuberosum TaxID=4113 RepID=M1BKL5_SOLTU
MHSNVIIKIQRTCCTVSFSENYVQMLDHTGLCFLLLHMKPIREGNYIIQPKVDFDISISTVAGLLNLGYVEYLRMEASFYWAISCSCIPSFPCFIISFAFRR